MPYLDIFILQVRIFGIIYPVGGQFWVSKTGDTSNIFWIGMSMETVTETNELNQEMISHILQLHELGLSEKAIQANLYDVYHFEASSSQINMITGKMDNLVNEWLNRLKAEGN